jgi:hypothetical protein
VAFLLATVPVRTGILFLFPPFLFLFLLVFAVPATVMLPEAVSVARFFAVRCGR